MPRSTKDPFENVREAFSDLATSEKAAFVLEATFSTLGQALAETGRRAAAVIDDLSRAGGAFDIDAWFTAPPRRGPAGAETKKPEPSEPPPMPATPADLKKTAARPSASEPSTPDADTPTADKPPEAGGKTPLRRPPADDES